MNDPYYEAFIDRCYAHVGIVIGALDRTVPKSWFFAGGLYSQRPGSAVLLANFASTDRDPIDAHLLFGYVL